MSGIFLRPQKRRRRGDAPATLHKPRGEQFYKERRLERRTTARGLQEAAAHDNTPNQSEFDEPEYVDGSGNEYRLASRAVARVPGKAVPVLTDLTMRADIVRGSNGLVRLWVRLPFNSGQNGWMVREGMTLTLQPVRAGLNQQVVRVVSARRRKRAGRTGTIVVTGFNV